MCVRSGDGGENVVCFFFYGNLAWTHRVAGANENVYPIRYIMIKYAEI